MHISSCIHQFNHLLIVGSIFGCIHYDMYPLIHLFLMYMHLSIHDSFVITLVAPVSCFSHLHILVTVKGKPDACKLHADQISTKLHNYIRNGMVIFSSNVIQVFWLPKKAIRYSIRANWCTCRALIFKSGLFSVAEWLRH